MRIRINKFFVAHGWLIWALGVACIVILCWFAFLPEKGLNYFFSSDAVYLPSLYRDFFQDGYTLNGWRLNQATNFFPDMPLFFLLNALFDDFITATFCYSLIQYFFIILLMYLIFKQLKPKFSSSIFALAIFLFSSFLFILFIDWNVWFSSLLLHNAFHNSAFILSLICVILFLKYLNHKSGKTLIAICTLTIVGGACDKLFFIYFSIPISLVIIVLYFFNKDWKTLAKFLITLALGTILAILLWLLFKNNPYFSLTKPYGEFTLFHIKDSWVTFSKQMYGYLTKLSFISVLTYLSLLTYFAVVIYVFVKTSGIVKKRKSIDNMCVFQLFVLFFTPIVIFTPVLAGSYDNVASLRYNYFPYILLPFNVVVLLSNCLDKNKLFKIILNTTLSVLIMGYLFFHFSVMEFGNGLKHFFVFYPEKAKIIEHYFSDDDNFKFGIADDYWAAKQVTMFSKKGLRIYCSWDSGNPWLHASNKYWFTDNDKGRHAHCEFTFFLWSKHKEVPDFFKDNNDLQPIDLGNWNLYFVAPYRFIESEYRLTPVLIEKSANLVK